MSFDISNISDITTAATTLSNLILVSPQNVKGYQPQNANGNTSSSPPPSFVFNYEGEQAVALQSDITDHFVEDNYGIQDHWALRPEVFTTHGFVGELTNILPEDLLKIKPIVDKFSILGAYAPELSTAAQIALTNASFIYSIGANVAKNAVSLWDNLNGIGSGGTTVIDGVSVFQPRPNQSKQQVMFQQFYGYWRNRTLFTVQTPWAIFQNMAIRSVRAIQDANSQYITDFEVSFKLLRTASTITDANLAPLKAYPFNAQSAKKTDYGSVPTKRVTSTVTATTSILSGGGVLS